MNHQYVRPRNHPPIIVRLAPVILFFLLLLVNACEKDIQYLSGQLVGSVILYDSEIKRMPDHSGVEITVEGSNPLIKAITNEKGQFVIDDLKSGTYNFIFNKEGYYQHKQNGYMFVGGPKPSSIYRTVLFGIPDGRIENLEISEESVMIRPVLAIKAKTPGLRHCRYFLGNSDVSYKNYISTNGVTSGFDGINHLFNVDTLKFPVGSELYLIMYPATEFQQYYTDINSNLKIYTSINVNKPSEVVSITVPKVNNHW
jgi:hypothetical protein